MAQKKKATVAVASQEELALLDKIVGKVKEAQRIFSTYTQEQVDKIFRAAAIAAAQNRIPLSKLAVEETGMGVMEDKVIKNQFALLTVSIKSQLLGSRHREEVQCLEVQ